MNHEFDELAKALAQPEGRRAALKRFGVGLAGMALSIVGLGRAVAGPAKSYTCCLYERYYPSSTLNGRSMIKVCQPPGVACEPTVGGWETYQYRLIGAKEVADCKSCK